MYLRGLRLSAAAAAASTTAGARMARRMEQEIADLGVSLGSED